MTAAVQLPDTDFNTNSDVLTTTYHTNACEQLDCSQMHNDCIPQTATKINTSDNVHFLHQRLQHRQVCFKDSFSIPAADVSAVHYHQGNINRCALVTHLQLRSSYCTSSVTHIKQHINNSEPKKTAHHRMHTQVNINICALLAHQQMFSTIITSTKKHLHLFFL